MNNTTFIGRLLERRVPQITGLYIAATWMMIEIGDWVSERFELPMELTSYVFVGMVVFLPSVIMLAYQYGKKGKESWQKSTFIVVPLNMVFSILCMAYFVQPAQTTEIKVLVDESGQKQVFEVARAEHRKMVMVSFLNGVDLPSEFDWARYAVATMLSEELGRDIYLSTFTPFKSMAVFDALKDRGLEQGNVMPPALLLKLAKERFVDYLVLGDISRKNPVTELSIKVYDVKSNEIIGSFTQESASLFKNVEDVAKAIRAVLDIPKQGKPLDVKLPLTEYFTSSLSALELFTEAYKLYYFKTDIDGAVKLLRDALEIDPQFVYARGTLGNLLRSQGLPKDAMKEYALALKHDYKISQQDQFLYRSSLFHAKGDYDALLKLLDMWVEIYPEDTDAHQQMARMQMSMGKDLDKAEKSLLKLKELMPENDNFLVSLASLRFLKKDFDAVLEYMNTYIERNPTNKNGYRYLASFYLKMGEHEKARECYDKILLLEPTNFEAQLNNAYISIMTGQLTLAKSELDDLMSLAEKPAEKISVNNAYQWILTNLGQYQSYIERFNAPELDYSNYSPLSKLMSIELPIANAKIMLGRYSDAIDDLQNIASQLQHPYDQSVSSSYILAYYYQKDVQKLRDAVSSLAQFVVENPNPWLERYLDIGKMYLFELEQDYSSALVAAREIKEEMSKSLSTSSNSFSYLNHVVKEAEYMILSGQVEEAIVELEEVLRIYPSFSLAKLYLLEGQLVKGNRQAAENLVSELDELWKKADADYYYFKIFQSLKQQLELN